MISHHRHLAILKIDVGTVSNIEESEFSPLSPVSEVSDGVLYSEWVLLKPTLKIFPTYITVPLVLLEAFTCNSGWLNTTQCEIFKDSQDPEFTALQEMFGLSPSSNSEGCAIVSSASSSKSLQNRLVFNDTNDRLRKSSSLLF